MNFAFTFLVKLPESKRYSAYTTAPSTHLAGSVVGLDLRGFALVATVNGYAVPPPCGSLEVAEYST